MINKNSKNSNKIWTIYRHLCKPGGFSYIGQMVAVPKRKYHCSISKVLSDERALAGGYRWRRTND